MPEVNLKVAMACSVRGPMSVYGIIKIKSFVCNLIWYRVCLVLT